jgi:hypothetical protein
VLGAECQSGIAQYTFTTKLIVFRFNMQVPGLNSVDYEVRRYARPFSAGHAELTDPESCTDFKGSLKRNGDGLDDCDRGSIFETDIDFPSPSPPYCFAQSHPLSSEARRLLHLA